VPAQPVAADGGAARLRRRQSAGDEDRAPRCELSRRADGGVLPGRCCRGCARSRASRRRAA
jgi:hypothetical protein